MGPPKRAVFYTTQSDSAVETTMQTNRSTADDNFVLRELNRHAVANNIPLSAHIDLTYRCDLACVHCYLEERIKSELSLEEIKALLDDLRDMGCLMVLLSGGDLFLRPDALDILRAACERRFFVQIITHGNHIDEDVAEEIAQMGIGVVKISIYSSRPEVHDRVTKVPGSLHASLRAITALRRRGVRVEMKCPVMDINEGAQLEIPILAAKYDCVFNLDHSIRSAQGKGSTPLPTSGQGGCGDLRALNADIETKIQVLKLRAPHLQSLRDLPHHSAETPVCTAGRSSVYVDPEGNVTPCLHWEEPAGNVRDVRLRDLWGGGDVFLRARDTTRGSFSGCQSCENFAFCDLCPGQAHRESGSHTGVSPSSCRDTTARRLALETYNDDLLFDLARATA